MRTLTALNYLVAFCLGAAFLPFAATADEKLPHPETYQPRANEVKQIKKSTDDPTDLTVTYPQKEVLPPEIWEVLTFDVEEAARETAEILGFKSPDLVGKIAPEIKPGKYTYKDLEKYPGLRELFPPEMLRKIRPGGPPLPASIPEFEIIPTKQFHWFLNQCKITKRNLGKTKLDEKGYILPRSWEGGFPFPRPSGKFRAQQLYYNFEKRVLFFDHCFALRGEALSLDKNLEIDKYIRYESGHTRLKGRALFPPYGWLDERAKRNNEDRAFLSRVLHPRALRGTVVLQYMYDDPYKMDPWMVYVPSLRRIRKMGSTDTQDPQGDMLYDDRSYLTQKITPKKYPYKFDIIDEREYLLPAFYNAGGAWIDSKSGYALRGVQFMRRPCYVLQMTQLDRNYTYSKRVIFIDKEFFNSVFCANYDQRGQLYRTQMGVYVYAPETGQFTTYGTYAFQFDHLDLHTTFQMQIPFPADYAREDFSIQSVVKKGK